MSALIPCTTRPDSEPVDLFEVRTTFENGARESVTVPASQARTAYRAALAKAWRNKAGFVEVLRA